jgi:hypothetical protein
LTVRHRCRPILLITLLFSLTLSLGAQSDSVASLRQQFLSPPDNARVMMRWWWFGPAVDDAELSRELHTMKEGGIGGVEIQPVYALALDDPQKGIRNTPYLSDEFLHAVSFANQTARQLGMRVSITLGSGWPYGGPHIPVTQAAGQMRLVTMALPPKTDQAALPPMENGEALLAAFIVNGTSASYDAAKATQIPLPDVGAHSLTVKPDGSERNRALLRQQPHGAASEACCRGSGWLRARPLRSLSYRQSLALRG